jgi:hypothetical protein
MSEFWHGTPEVETSRPLVSVVVSVRGNAGSLHGLLTALAGQGPGPGRWSQAGLRRRQRLHTCAYCTGDVCLQCKRTPVAGVLNFCYPCELAMAEDL